MNPLSSPRSVLLLCFYYPPSKEVGGRRILGLGRFLAARNVKVSVINGIVGAIPQSVADPGIELCQVEEPAPILIGMLVAVRRALRRLVGSASHAASPEPAATAPAHGEAARPGLKELFFRFVHFMDDHKKWALVAASRGTRIGRQNDVEVVWASGPPMSGLLAGLLIARRLRRPLIVDFRDPWWHPSDSLERLGVRATRFLEGFLVKRAAAVTCTSPGLTAVLKQRYPRKAEHIHTIMNGFDGSIKEASTSTNGHLRIVFAGALYYYRDPFPFFRALDHLLSTPGVDASKVLVTFVGECASYKGQDVRQALAGRPSDSVTRLLPPVSQAEAQQLNEQATVLLNFAQNQKIQIPAKTFEQLVAQRELLMICERDSDTATIAEGVAGVHIVEPDDESGLKAVLADLYHRHVVEGRLTAPGQAQVGRYSRDSQNESLLHVMSQLGGSSIHR